MTIYSGHALTMVTFAVGGTPYVVEESFTQSFSLPSSSSICSEQFLCVMCTACMQICKMNKSIQILNVNGFQRK